MSKEKKRRVWGMSQEQLDAFVKSVEDTRQSLANVGSIPEIVVGADWGETIKQMNYRKAFKR